VNNSARNKTTILEQYRCQIMRFSTLAVARAIATIIAPDTRVICDGVECMIPSTEVVLGDIIILSLEDHTPADLRVIESTNKAFQREALTEESVLIDKSTDIIEVSAGEHREHIPLRDRKNM